MVQRQCWGGGGVGGWTEKEREGGSDLAAKRGESSLGLILDNFRFRIALRIEMF